MSDTGTVASPGQGMAIAALVLGCVSIVFFWLYGIVPILAIVFGGVSMNQAKRVGAKPNGMAIAGLVLGIVFAAVAAIMWLAILGSA
jgi:hypothetical protein